MGKECKRTSRGIVDEIREKKKEMSGGKYVRLITPRYTFCLEDIQTRFCT